MDTLQNSNVSIFETMNWLMNKGIIRLADITSWDVNGNWNAWSLPLMTKHDLPNYSAHQNLLLNRLMGLTPIYRTRKDSWGWGIFGVYSIANGFKQLQSTQPCSLGSSGSHNAALWKMVWNLPSIPKFNFFNWTIMHQKILTGENLVERGFFGPFRCCFCHQVVEFIAHIFVDCVFAQKVWALFFFKR